MGLKAVNALSEHFVVESYRDGMSSFAEFREGKLCDSGQRPTKEKNGTMVKFIPDEHLFVDYTFHMDIIETMMKNYSYLKKGLTLNFNGTPYKSEHGLLDLIKDNMS